MMTEEELKRIEAVCFGACVRVKSDAMLAIIAALRESRAEADTLRGLLGEALRQLDYMGGPRPFLFSARSYYERHGELPGHKGCLETAGRIRQALARDGVAAESVTASGSAPT